MRTCDLENKHVRTLFFQNCSSPTQAKVRTSAQTLKCAYAKSTATFIFIETVFDVDFSVRTLYKWGPWIIVHESYGPLLWWFFCCHFGSLTTLINALNDFSLVLIVVFSLGFISMTEVLCWLRSITVNAVEIYRSSWQYPLL